MSKIPSVFAKSKRINHFLCDNWAAFHKATPFHGIDHSTMTAISQIGKSGSVDVSIGAIIAKKAQKTRIGVVLKINID